MYKKIGLLLAVLMGQQVMALEITKTLTVEEVVAEVIAAPTIDEAKTLLDRCSIEERQLITQSLKQALLQWVTMYRSRGAYADVYDQRQAAAQRYSVSMALFAGAATVAVGVAVYKIVQAYSCVKQSSNAFQEMGIATNDQWLGKATSVNGIAITSPYFVDGVSLGEMAYFLEASLSDLKSVESSTKWAFQCACLALFSGIVAEGSYNDVSKMQQNLDRYDRMQALVAYLEK